MKAGISILELAKEIDRRASAKADYVADTRKGVAMNCEGQIAIAAPQGEIVTDVSSLAHGQIAEHVGVPKKYYDRMLEEAPDLLAANVNRWFEKNPSKRMVRTLDGRTRAFLSDKYRTMENEDFAQAVMPILGEMDVQVVSSQITESRLYLKVVDNRIQRDIPNGKRIGDGSHEIFDTCSPALVLSNSEVGHGAMSVMTSVWTRQCTNLATFAQRSMRKYHTGARHELSEDVYAMLSDTTKRVTDEALWRQVRDIVKNAFEVAQFDALVKEMQGMGEDVIDEPVKLIERSAKLWGFNEEEKGSVLKHLINGGNLTRFGLFNAVTRTAEDIEDYDRASEFERLGGAIVELPKGQWKDLALAA